MKGGKNMSMKVTIEGYGTLTGSPVTLLRLMQDARIFDKLAGDDLITEVRNTLWRVFGADIHIEGNTLAERAESLLRGMAEHNIVKIEEE